MKRMKIKKGRMRLEKGTKLSQRSSQANMERQGIPESRNRMGESKSKGSKKGWLQIVGDPECDSRDNALTNREPTQD